MNFDIVGVGYACLDHLGIVPRIPGVDDAVQVERWEVQGGGVVAQALVAAARLGASTAYIGNLGDDDTGRALREGLRAEGVDVSLLTLEPGRVSPTSFIAVEASSGKRTIFAFPGTMSPPKLADAARLRIAAARSLHLDATHFDTALAAAQIARAAGVRVSLDACVLENDPPRTRELIRLTDILVANETFPSHLTGVTPVDDACRALARLGPPLVVATLGHRGAVLWLENRIVHVPAFPVDAIDTTGAGDVFHGAFLTALLRGRAPEDAARFACAAAAINCRTFGGRAGIPRLAQVDAYLREAPPTMP